MQLSVMGVDLAKDIIQVRGSQANGKKLFNKAIKQSAFFEFIAVANKLARMAWAVLNAQKTQNAQAGENG